MIGQANTNNANNYDRAQEAAQPMKSFFTSFVDKFSQILVNYENGLDDQKQITSGIKATLNNVLPVPTPNDEGDAKSNSDRIDPRSLHAQLEVLLDRFSSLNNQLSRRCTEMRDIQQHLNGIF